MKIGTFIEFNRETFENKICNLKDKGFDNFQLSSWDPDNFTDENAEFIKSVIEKYNVEISADGNGDVEKFFELYIKNLDLTNGKGYI